MTFRKWLRRINNEQNKRYFVVGEDRTVQIRETTSNLQEVQKTKQKTQNTKHIHVTYDTILNFDPGCCDFRMQQVSIGIGGLYIPIYIL